MQLCEVKRPLVALAALFFCLLNFYFLKYSPTSSGKDQGCVHQWITSFIFFFHHEQAVSWESCNLIGSGSWQYFILFTGLGWYWEKLCPLYWYSVVCGGPFGMILWGCQFFFLKEQELHYIFVKKSIFLPWLNILYELIK